MKSAPLKVRTWYVLSYREEVRVKMLHETYVCPRRIPQNRHDTKRLLGTRYASSVIRPFILLLLLLLCWFVLQVQSSVTVRSTVYDCCCCILFTVEDLRDIGRQIELCLRSGGKDVADVTATAATAAAAGGEDADGDEGDCRSCAAGETSTQTVLGSWCFPTTSSRAGKG